MLPQPTMKGIAVVTNEEDRGNTVLFVCDRGYVCYNAREWKKTTCYALTSRV